MSYYFSDEQGNKITNDDLLQKGNCGINESLFENLAIQISSIIVIL